MATRSRTARSNERNRGPYDTVDPELYIMEHSCTDSRPPRSHLMQDYLTLLGLNSVIAHQR